ncbi:MAG: DUF892 family protein [Verrucomicrobiota bacterium]
MKPTSPLQILSNQLVQLHCMETHIARELPILAGSALNASLRRWLSRRAMAARARRDRLQDLVELHAHPFPTKTPDSIRGILAEGNRDLARIHHPCSRDVAVIEHCIRIEQHAITAYGIAVPLTDRIGFPRSSDKLKPLLGDLETARLTFKILEAEVFSIAASHPHTCEVEPRSSNPAKKRNELNRDVVEPLEVAC